MDTRANNLRFEAGLELSSLHGKQPVRVGRFLGARRNGEHYEVETAEGGGILRLLNGAGAVGAAARLADQIESGRPDEMFLWPADLIDVSSAGDEWIGYLVAPQPAGYVPVRELVNDPTRHDLRVVSHAARNLAFAFRRLNQMGYSFSGFAPGDLLIHPATGEIVIDAAEDIVVDRDPAAEPRAQPRFLAPEIVRGEALPSEETDRHILALSLFILLFAAHPLERKSAPGVQIDEAEARRLYGRNPSFIFDPVPGQSAADRSAKIWNQVPEEVRQDFQHTFGLGLHVPSERLSSDAWGVAMTILHDSLFACGACRALNCYCSTKVQPNGQFAASCHACGRALQSPLRMRIAEKAVVVLESALQLYPIHLLPVNTGFKTPSARVVPLRESPGKLGLQNETAIPWQYTDPSGAVQSVSRGKAVPLAPGVNILFGGRTGFVRG